MHRTIALGVLLLGALALAIGCAGQNQDPTADFTASPENPEANTAVTLDASSSTDEDGEIATYRWTLPDDSTVEGEQIEHAFSEAGEHEIQLEVVDDDDATATVTKTITVTEPASAQETDQQADEQDEASEDTADEDTGTQQADETASEGQDQLSRTERHIQMSEGTSIRIPMTSEPRSLMPNTTSGTWESAIGGLLFSGMVTTGPDLRPIPNLAHDWEWNEADLTYTFHLREGIQFHDGHELTCEDVVFSFKTVMHPQYPGVRFPNFQNVVGAYEYRNRVLFSADMEATDALNAGNVPESFREQFQAHDRALSSDVDVSYNEENEIWTINDQGNEVSYTVAQRGGEQQLDVRLPEGQTIDWPISGLSCPDEHTFTATLKSVQRTFLPYAAGTGIMPKHVYEPVLEERGYGSLQGLTRNIDRLVGTGPYRFTNWKTGQSIELSRNENYWQGRTVNRRGQMPMGGIETLYWVVRQDPDARFSSFRAGEIDVTPTTVDQHFQLEDEGNPNQATYTYPELAYEYYHWNLRMAKFQDERVRRAMCWAVDRQQLVERVLRGLGQVANGPTHPIAWDYDEQLEEIHPGFDRERTIELMEEAGWTIERNDDGEIPEGAVWTKTTDDGETMEMSLEIAVNQGAQERQRFAVLMQRQLGQIGFDVEVRTLDTNAFYNDYLMGSNDFETAIAGWRLGTDPDLTSIFHSDSVGSSFNWMAYTEENVDKNPDVDALIDEGLNYVSIDEAQPVYQELNRKVVDDMPYCWLVHEEGTFAADANVQGVEPFHPQGWWINMPNWYVADEGLPMEVQDQTASAP